MIEEEIRIEHDLEVLGGSRWRGSWARVMLVVLAMFAIGLVWHLVSTATAISPLLLPPPGQVGAAFSEFRAPLLEAAGVTLVEVIVGFALAVTIGVLISIGITYSSFLRPILYPMLVALHSIPKVAIAPLLLIWFGFGITSKMVVAFLVALFPIVIETVAGLRFVDPELHELAKTLRTPRLRRFWMIDFPSALPYFFSGLKVGVSLAVVGAVIGEFLSADRGLGFILQSAASLQQTDLAFAAAITVSAMSLTLFALVAALEWLLLPWARDSGTRV